MAWQLSLGKGLADFGQILAQFFANREERNWRGEQAALDRALQERGRATQERGQEAQAAYYEGLNADRVHDNEARDVDMIAKYFGGQEITPEVASRIPERFRGVMVKTDRGERPAPAGLPGAPEKMETFAEPKMTLRQPVTSGERIATTNANARLSAEQLRQDYLTRKLAQDKDLAVLADETDRARINAMLSTAAERIALGYAGLDNSMAEKVYQIEADAIIEKYKADKRAENPGWAVILGQQPGGSAAPAAPAAPGGGALVMPRPPAPARPGARPSAPRPTDPNDPFGLKRPR